MSSKISCIPDELLVRIFCYLPEFKTIWSDADIPLSAFLPYPLSDDDRNSDPMQGARVMPFLGQVSKHWRNITMLSETQVRFITRATKLYGCFY